MKTIKLIVLCLSIVSIAGVFFPSCKKKETTKTYSYRSAQDNATAEATFSRSYNQISKASRQVGSKSTDTIIAGCPTLTITGSWPKTLTIDFGTGCLGDDGVTRRGQIVCAITGLYVDSASVVSSTFQNFYETINNVDHQIQGTEVITNLGHNQAGHPYFSVDVQNASITYSEGTINWTSQRQNEWINGYNTYLNPFDDEYNVTGVANGTDISGAPFTVTITSPLLCKFCTSVFSWIVASGKFDLVNPGYPTITVDYGQGTCDWTIYVTVNGTTYTIVYV